MLVTKLAIMSLSGILFTCCIIGFFGAGLGNKVSQFKICDRPELWCKDVFTARQCGVLKYCKMVWNTKKGINGALPMTSLTKSKSSETIQPIKVSLYFESLCPGCRQFFLYQMYPTFQKLESSGILEVELVPFGNAQERPYGSSWTFYCQHGQTECVGNLLETCAINLLKDASKYMPFIHCLEYYGPSRSTAEYCASLVKVDYNSISACASSSQGIQMEHEMAVKTASLNPPHQYVPWITVNGYHTDQIQSAIQSNMLQYVCNAYRGTKPAACNSAQQFEHCHKNKKGIAL